MNIFVTGATGFVGRFIVQELVKKGHNAYCLVRERNFLKITRHEQIFPVFGDVTRPETLNMKECEAVIHLVAIIRENGIRNITFERLNFQATQNVVDAAMGRGIKRFIHMSALGASPDGLTPYLRTKGRAQQIVEQSGLEHTIFRPSFIFGPGDAVYGRLAKMVRMSPFGLFPVFGTGEYRHQPVSVFDVSTAIVRALTDKKTRKRIYDVGGPDILSFNRQLEVIGNSVGRRVRKIHIAMGLSRFMVGLTGWLPFSPIELDQLKMLTCDNICTEDSFQRDFGSNLIPFEKGLEYLSSR
jgi:uncharacterized protein YbjT (DUF2867 family)